MDVTSALCSEIEDIQHPVFTLWECTKHLEYIKKYFLSKWNFNGKMFFFYSILNVTKRHAYFTTSFFGCFKGLKLQDVLQTRKS